jgi:site-specific recombinase XerD
LEITPAFLRSCIPPKGRAHECPEVSATARLLEKYFIHEGVFRNAPQSKVDQKLVEYREYLQSVRGLAPSTTAGHLVTVHKFLSHACPDGNLRTLKKLSAHSIEDFVKDSGDRVGRGFLQHIVARVRSFLRYLSSRGEAPLGLDAQIDTPRVYRGEKLPRALPWKTVCALLQSIDRSLALGKRDYAILLLIATYGLRSNEITNLKIDDVDWRSGVIRVFQGKTGAALLLPLTDNIGKALLSYLKRGRPEIQAREIFVRHRAPAGTLKPAAVSDVFQTWSCRSGLDIPFQGAHCLRHSYAVHLLRQGASLKVIGDVLGHRSPESTCLYLRLSVEDLRTVPLNLPATAARQVRQ